MNLLKDNEQQHHWLRQESFLAHQTASIERLEMAINSQKRTMQFQARRGKNFNKHRGYRGHTKNRNVAGGRFRQSGANRWAKSSKNPRNDDTEGNN